MLGLIAGTHGYEYAPILALQNIRDAVDPERLSSTLILVHVANMPSFLGRSVYYGSIDGKNLNRAFPGNPDGTVSERIAPALTTETGKLGSSEEAWVDLAEEGVWGVMAHLQAGYAAVEGTLLGTLVAFFGDPLADIRAPFAGVVTYVVGTPPVSEGEPLAMVSRIRRTDPDP